MSAEQSEIPQQEPTAIADVNTAVAKFDRVAAGIVALQTKYAHVVFDVTTSKGMKEACDARAAIRAPRYEVEKVRKEVKAPILELGKEIDRRAAKITAELLAIEEPIDRHIKAEEERKEEERKRKLEAERARVAAIQDDIEQSLRSLLTTVAGQSAAAFEFAIRAVVAIEATAERFAEFAATAAAVKDSTLTKLREMHAKQIAHEADQQRLADERAELKRQRIANEAAAKAERERIAAEKAAADAERKRQVEEQMAKLRSEREENQRVARELQAQEAAARAERERLDLQESVRRERQRLEDAERQAAVARMQQEERELQAAIDERRRKLAAEQAPASIEAAKEDMAAAPAPQEFVPSAEHILALVCSEFGVSEAKARGWLVALFGQVQS